MKIKAAIASFRLTKQTHGVAL